MKIIQTSRAAAF